MRDGTPLRSIVGTVDAMKIGNGQPALIDQMRQAHLERQGELEGQGAKPFELDRSGEAEVGRAAPTGLKAEVMGIADQVIRGEVDDVAQVRRQVIEAIVEERYADLIAELPNKRKALDTLEATLSQDPTFSQEVDRMLILAARDLARGGV